MKLGARERKFIIIGLGLIAVLALLYTLMPSPDSGELDDTVDLKKKTLLRQRETLYLEGVYESSCSYMKTAYRRTGRDFCPEKTPM